MTHEKLELYVGYADDLSQGAGFGGHADAMYALIREVVRLQDRLEDLESKLSLAESDAMVAAQEGT